MPLSQYFISVIFLQIALHFIISSCYCFNSDALLQAKLKFAAQELNLREHLVNGAVLYSACDVEGHKGDVCVGYNTEPLTSCMLCPNLPRLAISCHTIPCLVMPSHVLILITCCHFVYLTLLNRT